MMTINHLYLLIYNVSVIQLSFSSTCYFSVSQLKSGTIWSSSNFYKSPDTLSNIQIHRIFFLQSQSLIVIKVGRNFRGYDKSLLNPVLGNKMDLNNAWLYKSVILGITPYTNTNTRITLIILNLYRTRNTTQPLGLLFIFILTVSFWCTTVFKQQD
jgi:hypothetical protein